jgi:hypothetical protein
MIREESVVASLLCYVVDNGQRAGLWSVEVLICSFPHMFDASCDIQFAGCRHGTFPFSGGVASCVVLEFSTMLWPCNVFFAWCRFSGGRSSLLAVRDEARWMTNPQLRFIQRRRRSEFELVMQPQDLHSTLRNLWCKRQTGRATGRVSNDMQHIGGLWRLDMGYLRVPVRVVIG